MQDGDLTLFIGTDKGLLISQSNSGRDSDSEEWRFFYSKEITNITNSVGDLRTLTAGNSDNPAEVRNLLLDGPAENNPQILWFGTPSGLHQMRLIDNVISHSLQLENPGDEKKSSRDLNNIFSIHTTGEEVIIGSSAGTWILAVDYSNVYNWNTRIDMAYYRDNYTWGNGMTKILAPRHLVNIQILS